MRKLVILLTMNKSRSERAYCVLSGKGAKFKKLFKYSVTLLKEMVNKSMTNNWLMLLNKITSLNYESIQKNSVYVDELFNSMNAEFRFPIRGCKLSELIFPFISDIHDKYETLKGIDWSGSDADLLKKYILNQISELKKIVNEIIEFYKYLDFNEIVDYEINYFILKNFLYALTLVKTKWNHKVDRNFINSVFKIHWGHLNQTWNFLTQFDRNLEVSAIGYLDVPFDSRWLDGFGVMLKGNVTLAGRTDLQTAQWRSLQKKTGELFTFKPYNLIMGRDTYPHDSLWRSKNKYTEFLIKNWSPIAIIIDKTKLNYDDLRKERNIASKKQLFDLLNNVSSKLHIPIFDRYYNKLTTIEQL